MQINITNGTLTNIQETLTPDTNYTLPTTINVSGATSNYNSTSGLVVLTNPTSTITLEASGVASSFVNKITYGNSQFTSYYGNTEIASMWLGNVKIYEKAQSSGYSVGLDYYNNEPSYCEFYYSTDDGTSWTQITNTLSLTNVEQIKLKIKVYNTSGEYWATNPAVWLYSPYTSPAVQVAYSPVSSTTEYVSNNITLTANMTGYISCGSFD